MSGSWNLKTQQNHYIFDWEFYAVLKQNDGRNSDRALANLTAIYRFLHDLPTYSQRYFRVNERPALSTVSYPKIKQLLVIHAHYTGNVHQHTFQCNRYSGKMITAAPQILDMMYMTMYVLFSIHELFIYRSHSSVPFCRSLITTSNDLPRFIIELLCNSIYTHLKCLIWKLCCYNNSCNLPGLYKPVPLIFRFKQALYTLIISLYTHR